MSNISDNPMSSTEVELIVVIFCLRDFHTSCTPYSSSLPIDSRYRQYDSSCLHALCNPRLRTGTVGCPYIQSITISALGLFAMNPMMYTQGLYYRYRAAPSSWSVCAPNSWTARTSQAMDIICFLYRIISSPSKGAMSSYDNVILLKSGGSGEFCFLLYR